MCTQECLNTLLKDNNFDIDHIITYYISYISIFNGIDFDKNDNLNSLIKNINEDINDYINKMKEGF